MERVYRITSGSELSIIDRQPARASVRSRTNFNPTCDLIQDCEWTLLTSNQVAFDFEGFHLFISLFNFGQVSGRFENPTSQTSLLALKIHKTLR